MMTLAKEFYILEVDNSILHELPSGSYLITEEKEKTTEILGNNDCAGILMEQYEEHLHIGQEVQVNLDMM